MTAMSAPACAFSNAPWSRRRGRSRRTRRWTAVWSSARCVPARATTVSTRARGQYVDLVEAGIIDPTKVVRVALENAVSVASVLLLTEATLTEIPEPKSDGMAGGRLPEE